MSRSQYEDVSNRADDAHTFSIMECCDEVLMYFDLSASGTCVSASVPAVLLSSETSVVKDACGIFVPVTTHVPNLQKLNILPPRSQVGKDNQ